MVELKWNHSAEGAIEQIKKKQYVKSLEEYHGNILLVGINYDKATKVHELLVKNQGRCCQDECYIEEVT